MSFMNEGTADRAIRIVAGIVLLALGWGGVVDGTLGTVFKFLGFVPLATGLMGWCTTPPCCSMTSREGQLREIADLEEIGLPAAKQRLRRGRMAPGLGAGFWSGTPPRPERSAHALLGCPSTRVRLHRAPSMLPWPAPSRRTSRRARPVRRCTPLWSESTKAVGTLRDPDSVVPPAVAERVARSISMPPR